MTSTHMSAHGDWVAGRFAGATARGPYPDNTIRVGKDTAVWPSENFLEHERFFFADYPVASS
jgi:hypothetical protein